MDNIKLIQKIRRNTGLGIMICKKALNKFKGNVHLAINYLLTIHKLTSKETIQNEGIIKLKKFKNLVVIVELNCVTDFVSKNINFLRFVNKVANKALYSSKQNIKKTDNLIIDRKQLITKLNENIILRNLLLLNLKQYKNHTFGYYVHKNRIGSIVIIYNCILKLAKDIAMQIIATKPLVIYIKDFTYEAIKKEKLYYLSQIKYKTLNKKNKLIKNKLQQFLQENSLFNQIFIKNNKVKIYNYLSQNSKLIKFYRFEIGQ